MLLLNTKNQVMGQRVVYQGNVNSSMIRPAEVLRPAVIEAVPSIIISHNHPSATTQRPARRTRPSRGSWPRRASSWGIELLDHVVIGGERFVSLKERGLMS